MLAVHCRGGAHGSSIGARTRARVRASSAVRRVWAASGKRQSGTNVLDATLTCSASGGPTTDAASTPITIASTVTNVAASTAATSSPTNSAKRSVDAPPTGSAAKKAKTASASASGRGRRLLSIAEEEHVVAKLRAAPGPLVGDGRERFYAELREWLLQTRTATASTASTSSNTIIAVPTRDQLDSLCGRLRRKERARGGELTGAFALSPPGRAGKAGFTNDELRHIAQMFDNLGGVFSRTKAENLLHVLNDVRRSESNGALLPIDAELVRSAFDAERRRRANDAQLVPFCMPTAAELAPLAAQRLSGLLELVPSAADTTGVRLRDVCKQEIWPEFVGGVVGKLSLFHEYALADSRQASVQRLRFGQLFETLFLRNTSREYVVRKLLEDAVGELAQAEYRLLCHAVESALTQHVQAQQDRDLAARVTASAAPNDGPAAPDDKSAAPAALSLSDWTTVYYIAGFVARSWSARALQSPAHKALRRRVAACVIGCADTMKTYKYARKVRACDRGGLLYVTQSTFEQFVMPLAELLYSADAPKTQDDVRQLYKALRSERIHERVRELAVAHGEAVLQVDFAGRLQEQWIRDVAALGHRLLASLATHYALGAPEQIAAQTLALIRDTQLDADLPKALSLTCAVAATKMKQR